MFYSLTRKAFCATNAAFMYYLNLIIMSIYDRSKYGWYTYRVVEVTKRKTPGEWAVFCDIYYDTGFSFVISEAETNNVIPKVGDEVTAVVGRSNIIKQIQLNGRILWSADSSCQTKEIVFY